MVKHHYKYFKKKGAKAAFLVGLSPYSVYYMCLEGGCWIRLLKRLE